MERWLKLDNAAKVFPSVSNKKRSNLFRITFKLKERVEYVALQEALNMVLPRFSYFNVRLKKGLFWYYLESNHLKAKVMKELPHVCRQWEEKENDGFLFRLSYFEKRISLEVFHALTDGTGALEFLKALIYQYFKLLGKHVVNEDILTEFEEILEEKEDSFVKNYDPRIKVSRKEQKALKYRVPKYDDNWMSLISGKVSLEQLKRIAEKYQATITEFLSAILIMSASKSMDIFKREEKPFQLFVPVNLRRFFPSRTLRNFSLYVRTTVSLHQELTFEEILMIVKKDLEQELNKDKLLARIVSNVKIEKNFFMRIVPLFIKEFVMKLGYNAWGESANSLSFSNLGIVKVGETMQNEIDYVEFSNGASHTTPINLGLVSFGETVMITFSSVLIDRTLQKQFFRLLTEYGLDVTIHTNDLEVSQ